MPHKRQASEETQEKASSLLRFFIALRTASPSAPAVISNLLFYLSAGSFKSAIDTLISVAVFSPRDLKLRLTAQASFHLVECVELLQRSALMFFRVERRGRILKGGEETHFLPSL